MEQMESALLAEWEVLFRQQGAKFVQSLQEAAEEHLREQELLVGELLEKAKQDFGGARRQELSAFGRQELPAFVPLSPIELPSAPEELIAVPELPITPDEIIKGPDLVSTFQGIPEGARQIQHDLVSTFQGIPEGARQIQHDLVSTFQGIQEGARHIQHVKATTSVATQSVHSGASKSDCAPRKTGLHTYLDTQMGDLTAGVMTVTHQTMSSPGAISYLQRFKDCKRALEEPQRTGLLAAIVTSTHFELVTFVVILMASAFAIWMTNQLMTHPEVLSQPGVVWADSLFLIFFVLEVALKLIVHRLYFFCNEDAGWNVLDAFIIVFSMVDFALNLSTDGPALQDVKNVRALRALRISLRILRAVRLVTELRVLMMCIVGSFSVVFWCVLLLLLIQAGVSTALVQLVAGYVAEQRSVGVSEEDLAPLISHFGTVQAGMVQLFMSTTGGVDWGSVLDIIAQTGYVATIVYGLYLLFFFVAAWNIITSLFIEKAMKLAQPDMEQQMLTRHKEELQSSNEIIKLLEDFDTNHSGTISLSRFQHYMQMPRFRKFFEFRDLEIKDAEMFFRLLSAISDSDDVPYDTFAHGCLRMKGYASVLDVQSLRIELKTTYLRLTQLFKQLSDGLNAIAGQLESHMDPQVENLQWIPAEKAEKAEKEAKAEHGFAVQSSKS